jgi:hypothetical protein
VSYNPSNWYWLADDGRVFASARQLIVDISDADYVAWSASNSATPWPRDDAGNQTDAALQEVLTPFNLFVDLSSYNAYARFLHASGGVIVTSLSPIAFNTDAVSRNTINSAQNYLQLKGSGTVQWKMSDGSFVTLDGAQLTTLMNAVAEFVQSCFTNESVNDAAIGEGSITTQQQIDASFDAISNVYP